MKVFCGFNLDYRIYFVRGKEYPPGWWLQIFFIFLACHYNGEDLTPDV